MNKKKKQIEEDLETIEKHLSNAEEYLAKNVNVEGSPWLHLDDWQGKSGHPLWIRNVMIPATLRVRARKERVVRTIDNKAKDKRLTKGRRHR